MSVVFPASGCEIIANVRRLAISDVKALSIGGGRVEKWRGGVNAGHPDVDGSIDGLLYSTTLE